jgi:hypothetical protein
MPELWHVARSEARSKKTTSCLIFVVDEIQSMGDTPIMNTTNAAAAFGKIETCACCGKAVKKPVFSKRLGCYLGKDCLKDIQHARALISMCGDESAAAALKRDWPRVHEKLFRLAKI